MDLLERKENIHADLRTLHQVAEAEKRELSDDEKSIVVSLEKELATIISKLANQENISNESIKANKAVIIETYKGSQKSAMVAFQADAAKKATLGYFPTSQSWAPGSYGCGSFILALLLCFILIGIVVFIYMLIVKPDGVLSVTYELREAPVKNITDVASYDKTCPKCAEYVKAAALVCRYCGHNF
jgi:hypothetical protein